MDSKRSIPGWVGPLAGPVLGAFFGLGASSPPDGNPSVMYIAVGAVMGFFAGLIVWWMDHMKTR